MAHRVSGRPGNTQQVETKGMPHVHAHAHTNKAAWGQSCSATTGIRLFGPAGGACVLRVRARPCEVCGKDTVRRESRHRHHQYVVTQT